MNTMQSRAGSVLLAVVVALVLIEVLVAGTLLMSAREVRAVAISRDAAQARRAADAGLAAAVRHWDTRAAARLYIQRRIDGATGAIPGTDRARFATTIERLAIDLYLIRAVGTAGGTDSAASASAMLVRTASRSPFLTLVGAALTSAGQLTVAAGATIEESPLRACDGAFVAQGASGASIRTRSAGAASIDPAARVTGAVAADTTVLSDPAAVFAQLLGSAVPDAADREAQGSLVPIPLGDGIGQSCDFDAVENWGDPDHPFSPCGGHAPLVHAPGDLRLTGGVGQGILVVDGDLRIEPAARYDGIVIVGGALDHAGEVNGTVLTGAAAGSSTISGTIRFDTCAITRALALLPALATPADRPGRRRVAAW